MRAMTSAYDEAMTEREQTAATLRATAKLCPDQELDIPETLVDVEERSSSLTSLATGDFASEEFLVASSSVAISVLPGESIDEGFTSGPDEQTPRTTDGHEKDDDKDNHEANLDCSANPLNETNDISRMDKSGNKESLFFGDHERQGDMKELVTTLSASCSIASENSTMCTSKKEQVKDQRNQSVLEMRAQERHTCGNVHVEENFRDSHEAGTRTHYENAKELHPDETRDVVDREIVQGCQSDSYNFYDAVRSGNVKRVSALIASGCVQNLDEPDWNVSGDPPLLVAATNQCLPVLR